MSPIMTAEEKGGGRSLIPIGSSGIEQTISLQGNGGREDIFLTPVEIGGDSVSPRLVLEGATAKRDDGINGRVRRDYSRIGDRIFTREQVFSEFEGKSVLSEAVIKCNRGPIDITYYIVGWIGVTPRLQQDPTNYSLYIDARIANQPLVYPSLAMMAYKYAPQSSYPYRGFILHGEFTELVNGGTTQSLPDDTFNGEYPNWRKLRYYFAMGRGWRVLDEKPEYNSIGVPSESFKDVIANSKRRSMVETSEYAFKVGYKEKRNWRGGRIELCRYNTRTKSQWVLSVPLWENRRDVIRDATTDTLDDFLYNYPASLSVQELGKSEQKFSTA